MSGLECNDWLITVDEQLLRTLLNGLKGEIKRYHTRYETARGITVFPVWSIISESGNYIPALVLMFTV